VYEFKYAANVHLDAVEHGAENNKAIVFMHKVEEGAANQSYGLQVAQLAGIPKSVVSAAKRKLTQLENSQVAVSSEQPDMFANSPDVQVPVMHPALLELELIQPDDLTPREALEVLYRLKNL
jgi:DNA mismatch repair protein MutS